MSEARRRLTLELANAAALACALALAMAGASLAAKSERTTVRAEPGAPGAIERLPDGTPALRDARRVLVPLTQAHRIASGALVADRVLADLCEPERVVAYSRYAANTPDAARYAAKAVLSARDSVEHVLALKPDLVLFSDLVDAAYVAQLEAHGIRVFVLEPMEGLATLLPAIRTLGSLIGHPERAARYADALATRLANVARDAPEPRPRTAYLSIYGDKLFAAGARTSYHDVIEFAGLRDAVALAGLSGWPELTGEKVLTLDPDVLLTRTGMSGPLCKHPGLSLLRPCRGEGRVIELDGMLLDDPGPAMLEAAEALHQAARVTPTRR